MNAAVVDDLELKAIGSSRLPSLYYQPAIMRLSFRLVGRHSAGHRVVFAFTMNGYGSLITGHDSLFPFIAAALGEVPEWDGPSASV